MSLRGPAQQSADDVVVLGTLVTATFAIVEPLAAGGYHIVIDRVDDDFGHVALDVAVPHPPVNVVDARDSPCPSPPGAFAPCPAGCPRELVDDCDDTDPLVFEGAGRDNDCAGDGDGAFDDASAVFVDTNVDVSGDGTRAAPLSTLSAAAAVAAGRVVALRGDVECAPPRAFALPAGVVGGLDDTWTAGNARSAVGDGCELNAGSLVVGLSLGGGATLSVDGALAAEVGGGVVITTRSTLVAAAPIFIILRDGGRLVDVDVGGLDVVGPGTMRGVGVRVATGVNTSQETVQFLRLVTNDRLLLRASTAVVAQSHLRGFTEAAIADNSSLVLVNSIVTPGAGAAALRVAEDGTLRTRGVLFGAGEIVPGIAAAYGLSAMLHMASSSAGTPIVQARPDGRREVLGEGANGRRRESPRGTQREHRSRWRGDVIASKTLAAMAIRNSANRHRSLRASLGASARASR